MTTLPRVSKKGFVLAGDKADVLLLHGYTGTPYDLRPLGDFLAARGCAVHVPLLLGHGTKPHHLLRVTATDWLAQANDVLESFDGKKPIIIGGLSMGALIAILLAANTPTLKALLLFSPALRLNRFAELMIASCQLGIIDRNSSLPKLSGGSDIADAAAKHKTPSYRELPLAGLLQFEKLRVAARDNLAKIACPVFLAFGKHDGAIDAHASQRMFLAGSNALLVSKFYGRSKHVVTLDYDRERLFADVDDFLTQRLGLFI